MLEFISSVRHCIDGLWSALLSFDVDTKINIVLTLVTAVIAVTNIWLVWGARKAHRMDLRAYVTSVGGVIEVVPHNRSERKFNVQARLVLKNQGRTPAYSFRTFPEIAFGPREQPKFNSHPVPPKDQNSSIIGAGESVDANCTYCTITTEELLELWSGNSAAFISLRVEYKDAFGKSRFFLARCANALTVASFSGELISEHEGGDVWTQSLWNISPHELGYDGD